MQQEQLNAAGVIECDGSNDMEAILEIMNDLDWSPLWISLKTGAAATFISFFLGIYAARKTVKMASGKKAVIDGILTLPMVLPPTVAGFFLLLLFSRRRPLGILLYENFDIKVVQTWLGCVIAATVIAFPLMYRNARAAFEQIDVNLVYAGRTLGMSEMRIFWTVVIPSAGPGIASGTILTFARALGEYGATSMLAGNIPGKTGTISQKIAMVIQDGDYATAGIWVAAVILIALAVIILMNLILGKRMKTVKRW
jgi:molybdate transport system permease protein